MGEKRRKSRTVLLASTHDTSGRHYECFQMAMDELAQRRTKRILY